MRGLVGTVGPEVIGHSEGGLDKCKSWLTFLQKILAELDVLFVHTVY